MSEHKGQTDKVTTVTLPSAVEAVQWAVVRAAPGATVGLDVFTRFVGNGATLQIKITDHRGTTHGSFKDQIHNNRLSAEVPVPPKAREALYAEVSFPKHGLSGSSPALLLTPPIEVDAAAWSQSEARRGDVLTLSADVRGAPDGTGARIEIFEHDADGAHDPVTTFQTLVDGGGVAAEWEYEYHEDTDDIPRDEEAGSGYRPPEYFFRVEVEGITAESDLLTFKDWIEIELLDNLGQPQANRSYEIHFPDGSSQSGTLDANGRAEVKDAPPGPYQVLFS
jgi:hypothetical protein